MSNWHKADLVADHPRSDKIQDLPFTEQGTMTAQINSTAFGRFRRLRQRYGLVHALSAGVGRKSQSLWNKIGPLVTSRYARNYLEANKPRLLNLGAGSHIIESMLNVDISPRADSYVDLTRKLPFADNTFDFIYSEEVIEHFDQETSLHVLKEAYRTLAPGGVARFTTPRLEYFIDRFHSKDSHGVDINGIFYGHHHRHIYSIPNLKEALSSAGFVDIRFTDYRDASSPLGKFDTHADRYGHPPDMSIYVDVRKS